jgi:hypothetical protein
MSVEFDAGNAPALPTGWTRDFLIYSDGWIKDADLNTAHGGTIAPLPFHGMSRYPYDGDERYPADDAHRRYRAPSTSRGRSGRDELPPLHRASRRSHRRRVFRHDTHDVVYDLEEAAFDAEAPLTPRAELQLTLPQQRHHRRVPGENAHLSIERRSDNRFRRPLEQHGFRRDDRDGEHRDQPCIFLAFATTSSMPPAMKNACSGR